MDPLTISAIMGTVSAASQLWDKYMPSNIEQTVKESALSDMRRLRGGSGGMSASKRAALQSEAVGQIDSEIQQAQAGAYRGAALSGQSGQAFNRESAALKAKMGAQQQAMSSIRQEDLEEAQRQRLEAYQKAGMAEGMHQFRKQMPMPDMSGVYDTWAKVGQRKRQGIMPSEPYDPEAPRPTLGYTPQGVSE